MPTDVIAVGDGLVLGRAGAHRRVAASIDELFVTDDVASLLDRWFDAGAHVPAPSPADARAPIGSQEVWACGVTYLRSRDARMAESEQAGAAVLYDRVYDADRPEIFVKATAHRVVGPGQPVRIRADSTWNVPEPELTLAVSAAGQVFGCTIGNDMSSRSIEGDNPLYIPQAKVYDGCAALGPHLVVGDLPGADTAIRLRITRGGVTAFAGETALSRLKRSFDELVGYLLLFVLQLLLIGQHLPFAAAAYAKVRTKRLHTQWRWLHQFQHFPFGIALFVFEYQHIHHIAGYGVGYKQYLAVFQVRYAFALRCVRLNRYILNRNFFLPARSIR